MLDDGLMCGNINMMVELVVVVLFFRPLKVIEFRSASVVTVKDMEFWRWERGREDVEELGV